MERRSGLDGLRAVAVLAVFFFHYEQTYFPGGLLGVQTFFVLSGWLITSLLARESEKADGIDYRRFMTRRLLRLVPALVCLVTGCLLAALVIGPSGGLSWWVPCTLLYVNNFLIPLGHSSGYVAPTWSLAVEMQFYLAWPFVLTWLLRHHRERAGLILGTAALVMFVVVGVLSEIIPLRWLYFPGLGGVTGLLAGSALALRPVRVSAKVGLGSVLALLGLFLVAPDWTHAAFWTGWIQLGTVLSVLIVGWLSASAGGAFSSRPMVWLGARSYAIYLFHSAVRVILATELTASASTLTVLGMVVTVALAALSYHLVEQPFLRLKARYETGRIAV